jgi:hypothetical protein
VKVLKNRAKWVAIKAVVYAVPGAKYAMDVEVITNEMSFYKKDLGLDDESLYAAYDYLKKIEKFKGYYSVHKMHRFSGESVPVLGIVQTRFRFEKVMFENVARGN